MSHFTVLVVGKDIEGQLAPFQENNMGDCPKQFLAFHDLEDEYRKDYETGTHKFVIMPDGRKLTGYEEEFRNKGRDFLSNAPSHVIPAGLEQRDMKFSEAYPTFEEYAANWHGSEKRDPKNKRFGYWENPNAKWDWYQIGGRWTGFFKLKPGASGLMGEPGLMTPRVSDPRFVDQVRKGDIDLAGMRDDAEKEEAERYDIALAAVAGTAPQRPWAEIRDECAPDFEKAREVYNAQERVIAWAKAEKAARTNGARWPFGMLSGPEYLNVTREQALADARAGAISTHAVVKDGQWFEKGKMGWWAIVSDQKEKASWLAEFAKLLDELPDDTLLTVVDCHI